MRGGFGHAEDVDPGREGTTHETGLSDDRRGAPGQCLWACRAQDADASRSRPARRPHRRIARDDEKAIAALAAAYAKAYNAGNAAAAAATFAEDAIVVYELGQRTEGRAGIHDQLAAAFADDPGSKMAIEMKALRFLGLDTALEEGRTTITPAPGAGPPEVTPATPWFTSSPMAAGSSRPSMTTRP